MSDPTQRCSELNRHSRFVRQQLRRHGVAFDSLDDLNQQVWVVALARMPGLPSDDAERGWLSQVCRRVAADHRRRRTSKCFEMDEFELGVAPRQLEQLTRQLDEQRCLEALAHLSEEQRDLLSLRGGGLSMREVAEVTGASEPVAYARCRAAIAKAARMLRRGELLTGDQALAGSDEEPDALPDVESFGLVEDSFCSPPDAPASPASMTRPVGGGARPVCLGNLIITRWRNRHQADTITSLDEAIDSLSSRWGRRLMLLNLFDADLRMLRANDRLLLRRHVRRQAQHVDIAVNVFFGSLNLKLNAVIEGILWISGARTTFVTAPSLDGARCWIEPRIRGDDGQVTWSRVTQGAARLYAAE